MTASTMRLEGCVYQAILAPNYLCSTILPHFARPCAMLFLRYARRCRARLFMRLGCGLIQICIGCAAAAAPGDERTSAGLRRAAPAEHGRLCAAGVPAAAAPGCSRLRAAAAVPAAIRSTAICWGAGPAGLRTSVLGWLQQPTDGVDSAWSNGRLLPRQRRSSIRAWHYVCLWVANANCHTASFRTVIWPFVHSEGDTSFRCGLVHVSSLHFFSLCSEC